MTANIPPVEFRLKVTYTKQSPAIYLSHLDTIDALVHAIRRAALPYLVTQGCHARPKISFGPPLALGHAGRCETFLLSLGSEVDPETARKDLDRFVPQGFRMLAAELVPPERKRLPTGQRVVYRLSFAPGAAVGLARSLEFLQNAAREIPLTREAGGKTGPLGAALVTCTSGEDATGPFVTLELKQGTQGCPSVSRILNALADFLGTDRDGLLGIEREAILE